MLCDSQSVAAPLCATASVASYSGERWDPTERPPHTKDFYFRLCVEAVFKMLETSEEGTLWKQTDPLAGLASFRSFIQRHLKIANGQSGLLQKWVLLRTQMCSSHLRGMPSSVSPLPTSLPGWRLISRSS